MNGNIKLMYLKEENEMIYIFFFLKRNINLLLKKILMEKY